MRYCFCVTATLSENVAVTVTLFLVGVVQLAVIFDMTGAVLSASAIVSCNIELEMPSRKLKSPMWAIVFNSISTSPSSSQWTVIVLLNEAALEASL